MFDYKQMFNAVDVRKSITEVYNLGVRNEDLCLMYKSNQKVSTNVRSDNGDSEYNANHDNNLQGPINATVVMDKVAKEAALVFTRLLFFLISTSTFFIVWSTSPQE